MARGTGDWSQMRSGAKGDIITNDGSNNAVLAVGSNGQVLTADSAQTNGIKWAAGMTNPMTTAGDVIYGGASGTPTRLAGGTSGYVLTSTGATSAPSWQASGAGVFNPYGSLASSAPPANAGLTWVNQGTSTASDTNGLTLSIPSQASDNWRMLVKTAPATPWTFTIGLRATHVATGSSVGGIVARDSGTSKFVAFWYGVSAGTFLWAFQKWTNVTTFSANFGTSTTAYGSPSPIPWPMMIFLRFTDDGTNHVCSFSFDGTNFTQLFTQSRTAFLATTDQIGIAGDPTNSNPLTMFVPYWNGI